MDLNENFLGCSPKIIESLRKISWEDIAIYPDYSKFVKKLSSFLDVRESELLLTNGADEAIQIIMQTFLDSDDEVIIPSPTFYLFENFATFLGAKKRVIHYNNDLSFPTSKIINVINHQTKMVILVNPNNPTGTSISREDIINILLKARHSIVLIDEAYFQFLEKSGKDLIKKFKNLVIIQTFSKAFGLAGIRLGYIIASKKIIDQLKKIALPYSVNSLSIIAGSAALDDLDFVDIFIEEVMDNKKFIKKELEKLGIKTYPSDANFFIARFGKQSKNIYENLKDLNILITDVSDQPLLKNCLRIGVGSKDQMEMLANEIRYILEK